MTVIPDNFPELVRQLVNEKYSHGLKGSDKIYSAPNFPAKKLATVLKTYAEGVSANNVLLLFDNTFLGGAKEGFLMTDEALYWHNMKGLFKTLKLTALDHVMSECSGTVSELVLNSTERIRTGMLGEEILEAVTEMLRDIISLKSGLLILEDTSDGPDVNVPEEATPVIEEPVKKSFLDAMKELGSGLKEGMEEAAEATPGLHKLPRLGDPTGRTRQEIEELLGPPASLSKTCPACAEAILLAARKCRFCGEVLEPLDSYLAQWTTVLCEHLALQFDKDDVCKGIASHVKPL
jgi:hypothetical protein